jgi:Tfp pilus assembly protein FimT
MLNDRSGHGISGGWEALRRETGVTLTELVVVVSVIIIFAGLSLPMLGSIIPELKTRGGAEQVVETLRNARQNAIGTTATYRVIFLSTLIQTICTDNTPAGNTCPANRPPDLTEAVVGGATVAATPSEMRFDPKGSASTGAGNVIVTYPSGTSWRVEVNTPGRVRSCTGVLACP